jgi:transcription initiation factor IIE alpha subunit
MTYTINPKCPKCGHELTVKLNIVDRLNAKIKELEKKLQNLKDIQSLKDIFGGFK